MADPVVGLVNGVPTSGTGAITTLGQVLPLISGNNFPRVSDEPRQVFYDPFDGTLDVTTRWTVTTGNSGVAASTTSGVMTLGTGTSSNGWSKLNSQPTFTLPIPGWMGFSDAILLTDGAAPTANSYRYWGSGTTPATPTTAAPVTDGYGFELNTDGKLRAVVYAAGVRTVIQDLSTSGNSKQPLDANYHRYIIYVRTDKTYFYIDTVDPTGLVATTSFQSPTIQTLPRLFLTVANGVIANTTITCTGATAWDTGKNGTQISDGLSPWKRQIIAPTIFKQLNAVAIGSEATIWTPASGKKFRIMGGLVSVGTAAGNVFLKDNTAGTTILTLPKSPLDTAFALPPMGNGIISTTANNVLTATGTATATLSGYVFGTEE